MHFTNVKFVTKLSDVYEPRKHQWRAKVKAMWILLSIFLLGDYAIPEASSLIITFDRPTISFNEIGLFV